MREFSLSYAEISLITAVLSILGVLQLPAGYLVDRFGRKLLTLLGMLTVCVSIFFSSLSPSFLVLLILQVVAGIGQSTFHPATFSIVSEKASEGYLGKSIAFHQFGGFTGTAIGFIAIASLGALFGWRQALQIIAVPGFIVTVLTWKIIRETKMKQQDKTHSVEFRLTFPLIIIFLFTIFSGIAIGSFFFLPTFLSTVYGQSIALAGILTGIIQIVGCIAIVISGAASDKFNIIIIISVFQILTALSFFVLAASNFIIYILLSMLIFLGFVRDFPGPALTTLVSRVSSTEGRGRAIGLQFTGYAIGSFISSPLIGYLTDIFNIRIAFAVCAAFYVISGLVILPLKSQISASSSALEA
jgi:MFS family permease